VATAITATMTADENDEEVETKVIKVFGKEYTVSNPEHDKKADMWKEVMSTLGFDALPANTQKELKEMIYEDSTCLEEDFPISTSITCDPMRKIIALIAEELLKKGLPNDHEGTTIDIEFKPDEQVKELSSITYGLPVSEEPGEQKVEPTVEPKKGGLREKKRRTVRKRK